MNDSKKIIILTTGGTIEKTYDEYDGTLGNRESIIHKKILSKLRLPYTKLEIHSVLAKDSLEMDDDDREFISICIKKYLKSQCPVVVLHGTDTMSETAKYCFNHLKNIEYPVVFTGAMKPIGFDDSDAFQNFAEALLAAKILSPGYYISFHNRIYSVPNAKKNIEKRTFEQV